MKQIIGRKMGMTEVFAKDGTMYAVTVVEVLPNVVTQVKTKEKDGYDALQVGFEEKKASKVNGPERGHFAKANVKATKTLHEIKGDELLNYKVGDEVKADIFKAGDVVDVIGTSKGRGYAGTIKRWGHKIGPKGHGSGYHRGQGSFANNGRNNARVIPGKKMSGHHGNLSATILNLKVVEVSAEKNYILVKGAIPGPKKGLVTIRSAIKAQLGKPEEIKPLLDLDAEAKALAEAKAAEEAAKAAAEQAALEAKKAEEEAKVAAEKAAQEAKVEETAPVSEEATEVKGE